MATESSHRFLPMSAASASLESAARHSDASVARSAARSTETTETPKRPKRRLTSKQRVLATVLALAAIAGGSYVFVHRGIESTDDAQVDADIVALQTRYAGIVVDVRFRENQRVHRGDVLVVLDDAQARAKLAQAEASLAAAEANARVEDAAAGVAATDAVENRSIARASLQSEAAASDRYPRPDCRGRSTAPLGGSDS